MHLYKWNADKTKMSYKNFVFFSQKEKADGTFDVFDTVIYNTNVSPEKRDRILEDALSCMDRIITGLDSCDKQWVSGSNISNIYPKDANVFKIVSNGTLMSFGCVYEQGTPSFKTYVAFVDGLLSETFLDIPSAKRKIENTFDTWRSKKEETENNDTENSIGYHTKKIEKGVLGEPSKIKEELEEFLDALDQESSIMALVELSDMIGAVESYLKKHHPTISLDDLIKMSSITNRAFANGHR